MEIPTSNYKIGRTSVKLILISWLFTIPFNLDYIHIINSGLTDVCIKNSSDNLTKPFMIPEMYGCQCMILYKGNKHHLCIRDNLLNCGQPHNHIHLKEKKQVLQSTNSKMLFVKRKI